MLITDVLVVGGGFAGVAAAVAAARAGRRVHLIERRTYLGAESTGCLRPWLTDEPVPDRLKTALEDQLLDAGVTLLYAQRPVSLHLGDRLTVDFCGKAGRISVQAGAVVDATEQAVLARLVCEAAPRPARDGARVWRTIELTGVALDQLDSLTIPAELAPAWQIHRGYAVEQGHLLLEHAIDLVPGADSNWQLEAELGARLASARLCRWLKENHPAFSGLKLAATGHELAVPPLWRVVSGSASGVFVASACADLPDDEAVAMVWDPGALSQLGESVGIQAASTLVSGVSRSVSLPVQQRTVDVLVIGGGTSGVAAATGAVREGCSTLLIDMNAGLGGTGTLGGVDSYWFGRRGGFNTEVAAWVAEEHSWLGVQGNKWNIEAKMLAWQKGAVGAGVSVLLNTVLAEVRTDDSGRVTGALVATPTGLVEVTAAVTIDATGDGDVAVAAGAPFVYGSDREGVTMWYSLSPQVRPGVSKNNFTSTVNVGDPFDYTRAILSGRRRFPGHDHGPYVAPRESRHVLGDVRLTLTDFLTMRRWPDVINIHFSNHDIKGQNCSDWLRMGLIPPNFEIEIPYRAVVPQRVDGLLVTGKAISATHDGLPPLRMQADLENLGYVCGLAAGLCARRGLAPRELPVADLQGALVQAGMLPGDVLLRGGDFASKPTPAEMQQWIDALDDADKLYTYGEVEMDEIRRTPIPIVQVCTAGPEILPLLRAALGNPTGRGRLHVARALAWYGDRAATPVLLAAIEHFLAGDELPPRAVHIRYTQASPDHGAMPELAYLLHSLAMVRDPAAIPVLMRVAERLKPTEAQFQDQMSGIFHYVDSLCDIAERLGHPDCLPALRRLHEQPLFNCKWSTAVVEPDYFQERLAYLELTISRALARCGAREGLSTLIKYLNDSRRMLAEHAYRELVAITGQHLAPVSGDWEDWLRGSETFVPCPVVYSPSLR